MPYADPEVRKAFYAEWLTKNRDRSNAIKRAWAERNKERDRELKRQWNRANAHKVLAKTRVYQAKKLRAVPKWADLEAIAAIYKRAKELGMHVDHIVPLQSPLVCGLHCEANLQLLPRSENARKGNKNWPDKPV